MNETVATILESCGGIIGALLTFIGVRFTQRQTARAQQVTAEIERSKVEASAYTEARQVWDSIIKDLREQTDRQKSELADLRARLEDMERKRAGDRHAIHEITVYARRLLRQLEEHNLIPPPPPPGLELQA